MCYLRIELSEFLPIIIENPINNSAYEQEENCTEKEICTEKEKRGLFHNLHELGMIEIFANGSYDILRMKLHSCVILNRFGEGASGIDHGRISGSHLSCDFHPDDGK